jgi:hypothetical protein
LKPEWWGSPLAQEEKYLGRKKTCDKNDDDDDNNNNNNNNSTIIIIIQSTAKRSIRDTAQQI